MDQTNRSNAGCAAAPRWARLSGWAIAASLALVGLTGCLGGAQTESNPGATVPSGTVSTYTGPAPASADVQAFRVYVWENLRAPNRCGQCHVAGNQDPQFVRNDNINLAYQAALTVVDRDNPGQSLLVTKVAGGHNCWESSNAACAAILTTYLTNWLQGGGGGATEVQLFPPPLKDPGASKVFPPTSEGAALYAQTVYPVVWSGNSNAPRCERCHSELASNPQQPYFAGADIEVAYEGAKPKMNLTEPATSRLVVRLRDERHNCWSDCDQNAAEVLAAIQAFAGQIPTTEIDPALVVSKALKLTDGIVASGGARYDADTIALYMFKTGQGDTVYDISGVSPSLNLTLSGNVDWVGGWGIQIKPSDGIIPAGKAQGDATSSLKLKNLIEQAGGAYSIEAWVVPANVTQEDANIVSYSGGANLRNFTLGQQMYNYQFYNRSSASADGTADDVFMTDPADEVLQSTLQHVVVTFDPTAGEGRRIYVNGELVRENDASAGAAIEGWDDRYALVLGNDVDRQRLWEGVVKLVAIHKTALTPTQIAQNFAAGVGEKFYLLFSVGHIDGVPADSYVMLTVTQFDSYAYLFSEPTFINLDPAVQPDGVVIRHMRIGINGKEVAVGQAYAMVDTVISAADYTNQNGRVLLSEVGTVIALEQGPDVDEFFLTFEQIGNETNVHVDASPDPVPLGALAATQSLPAAPTIGLRTFEEIYATMAAMTGVDPQDPDVKATYQLVRLQMPTVENVEGFLPAHQTGIAQLAIEYCNALVEDPALRASFFAGFTGFDSDVATAFDSAGQSAVVNALVDNIAGQNLGTALTPAQIQEEMFGAASTSLYNKLTASCAPTCDPARTRTILKAMCASTIGSAAMLIQ